jgi:tight adherence protein B
MGTLLAMPEIWIGLGLFVLAVAFFGRGDSEKKKSRARLQRVTRKTAPLPVEQSASLRRREPEEGGALSQKLATLSFIETMRGRLEMAGVTTTPQKLLMTAALLCLGIMALLLLTGKPFALALLAGLLVGLAVPHLYVSRKLHKRQMQFLKLFPEAIDLIVRGLRAGLPVAESFNVVSREIPAPVGDMFATISQQTQLGVPMEKALADAAPRIDLTEFNFFVTTIILQRETGGNLGEILSNLSEMLRQRQMMKLKIGALSSEARASAYIVGALPFFVFGMLSVVSPDYLKPLYEDFRGNMSLAAAGGMMLLGGFIMKRMTMLDI